MEEAVAVGMDIDTPGPGAADKGKAPVSNGIDAFSKGFGIPWVRQPETWCHPLLTRPFRCCFNGQQESLI